jgi:hypothetical protein
MTDKRPIDGAKHSGARKGPVRSDRGAFGQDAGQSTGPPEMTEEQMKRVAALNAKGRD